MKDDKYVEEKAKELYNKYAWAVKGSLQGNVHQDCKDFIRTIIEECKPKVSRIELSYLAPDILDSITTSRVVGLIEIFLKSKGVVIDE